MKRVIALIISVAMVASLATGLAVTSFADEPVLEINDDKWPEVSEPSGLDVSYVEGTYTITVSGAPEALDQICTYNANLVINIPSGKTLTVNNPSGSAININGNLTVTGGGTLNIYSNDGYCIVGTQYDAGEENYIGGNITIDGCIISATSIGSCFHCFYAYFGDIEITNSSVTATAGEDSRCFQAEGGNVIISKSNITAHSDDWTCGIYAEKSGDVGGNIEISGNSHVVVEVTSGAEGIYAVGGNIEISNDSKVEVAAGTLGIYANEGNVNITDGSYVSATSKSEYAIHATGEDNAVGNITINNSTVYAAAVNEGYIGVFAHNIINITSKNPVKAHGTFAFATCEDESIAVNGITITDINFGEYFTNAISYGYDDCGYYAIKGTDWVSLKTSNESDDESDSDPEVDVTIGRDTITLKASNKSVVFNDKKLFEVEVLQSDNLFVPVDLSSAPAKIDGFFLNNDIYKYITGAGKGIELKTRFAKAEVYTNKEVGNNPLSLHLSDVSEVAGTCATAIQKKAMETSKVYAQVNYSFVSNGQPVENDAKIYVPVDGSAKVFYLFNENKIGIVPCEVIDGYCVFDRYFDGTYIVCADK